MTFLSKGKRPLQYYRRGKHRFFFLATEARTMIAMYYYFQALTMMVGVLIITFVVVAATRLLYPILFPHIIKYPWPQPPTPPVSSIQQQQQHDNPDKKLTVVLAGSYNPPHCGHLAMLAYLSQRYGKVIAVVGMNPNKTYPVSPCQRVALIRKMIQHSQTTPPLSNVQVQGTFMCSVRGCAAAGLMDGWMDGCCSSI